MSLGTFLILLGKLMTAIAQIKLILVGKCEAIMNAPQPVAPSPEPETAQRVERIAKTMTSKRNPLKNLSRRFPPY